MMSVHASTAGSPARKVVVRLGASYDTRSLRLKLDEDSGIAYVAYVPKNHHSLRRRDAILKVNDISMVPPRSVDRVLSTIREQVALGGASVTIGGDPTLRSIEVRKLSRSTPVGMRPADTPHGVQILSVVPASLAEKAGLKAGDFIYILNNVNVKNAQMFRASLQQSPLQINLIISRGCDQARCLTKDTTQTDDLFCNGCSAPISRGSTIMSCRKCDWDLCEKCSDQMGESNRQRQLQSSASSPNKTVVTKNNNTNNYNTTTANTTTTTNNEKALKALEAVNKRRMQRDETMKKAAALALAKATEQAQRERKAIEMAKAAANQYCRQGTKESISCAGFDLENVPNEVAVVYAKEAKTLELSFNRFRGLTSTHSFVELEELVADNNKLAVPIGLHFLPNLKVLSLNNNDLGDLHELISEIKQNCPHLEYLSLLNNTCCPTNLMDETELEYHLYRQYITVLLPNLKFLDSTRISHSDRLAAEKRFKYADVPMIRPIKEIIGPILTKFK